MPPRKVRTDPGDLDAQASSDEEPGRSSSVLMSGDQLTSFLTAFANTQAEANRQLVESLMASHAARGYTATPSPTPSSSTSKSGNMSKCTARFDGQNRDPEMVEAFIDSVEMYKECALVTDDLALRGLPMLLHGEAAVWWRGIRTEVSSWSEAVKRLRSMYGTPCPAHKLYRKIFANEQNEELADSFIVRLRVSRKEEVMAIKSKFPTKIPLIVERYHKERNLPTLDKSKFLVPEDITMSQFLVIIRNRIRIKPNQALYLIINNKSMLSMSLTMAQAYENYGDEDGFLYITYASQEVFGYKDDMNIKQTNQEVQAIRHRFPNKVPLYVERYSREREVPALGRNKFLVPQELTMSQFLYIIRTKMKLRDSQALYLLVNDKVLASHSMTMAQAYEQFRSHDGYLHITYAAQQVFG